MNIRQWQAGACSWMQWWMFITCILMFLCSCVWIKKNNHAVPPCRHSWLGPGIWFTGSRLRSFVAGICACIETSSLVLARDDVIESTVPLFCKCIHYSSVHQECGARHCKYFEWWTGGCAGGSLLMHAQTNEHHLHSYVLLFFCLDYLFASCLWWNCFCGCILFKRQKNIRTKEFIECSKDRSIKLDVHLFIQCDTPLVLGLRLLLLERNEEVDA